MSSLTPLSTGCLKVIMSGSDSDVEQPILQVLGTKRISSGGGGNSNGAAATERYRLLLSDGKFLQSFSMLATQLNEMVIAGDLADFCIIRVLQHITSTVNKSDKDEKRVLIVLKLEVLHKGTEVNVKIGDPQNLDAKPNQQAPTNTSTNGNNLERRSEAARPAAVAPPRNFAANSSNLNESVLDGRHSQPISSLTPYQNKWVIKARVTNKSTIRTWSNAKGEGKLFSMDLMDESGEIRCTGFREAVDKFYEMIQVDKVYFISKCQLKPANKQFTKIKNDYEMTMSNDTLIQECEDVSDMPVVQYDFVPVKNIQELENNTLIDVIGVCKEAGDVQTFTARATGRELKKRELTLVDKSDASVTLTLWGLDAENFNAAYQQPVVLIKSARVSEFNGGKTITVGNGSTFKINPDIVEGHKLRGWFDNGGGENITTSVSARTGAGSNFSTEWLTFQEAKAKGLGEGDRPDYFQLRGLIHLIRGNNAIYKACPQPECSKKVLEQDNGQYRCEKCNAEFPNFKYRLMLSMSIGDWTANRWVTCFAEVAEKILNKTSAEVGEAFEHSKEEGEAVLNSINFKSFLFKLRTKNEVFGDQARNKINVQSAGPINHKEYNQYLIKNIQQLTGVQRQ